MTRQATDNLYIELDYFTPEEYYIYEAVAASAQSTEFAVACDAEIITSGVIEANATFNSEGTTSIAVSKIASGEAAFVLEFTQDTTISHIHGSDLFAFNEATIALQVDRIRDTNITASSVFSIATDVEKIQQGDADTDLVFSAIINGLRSRDVNIETQAAFSFDVNSVRVKFGASEVSVQSSVSCDATEITPFVEFEASFTLDFSVTANCGKILETLSAISSTTELSVIISHVEGTDIVVNGFASLSAELSNVIKETGVALTSSATMQTNGGFVKSFNSNLQSTASMIVSSRILLRNTQFAKETDNVYAQIVPVTSNKFGGGSVQYQAGSISYPEGNIIWDGVSFKAFEGGRSFNGITRTFSSTDGATWTAETNNIDDLGLNGSLNNEWQYAVGTANNDENYRLYATYRRVAFTTIPSVLISFNNGITWDGTSIRLRDLYNYKIGTYSVSGTIGRYLHQVAFTSNTGTGNSFQISVLRSRVDGVNGPLVNDAFITGGATGLYANSFVDAFSDPTGFSVVYTTGFDSATTIIQRISGNSTGYSSFTRSTTADIRAVSATYGLNRFAILRADGRIGTSTTFNGSLTLSTVQYPNPKRIRAANNRWFLTTTTGAVYSGTDINNLTLLSETLFDTDKEIAYGNNKYVVASKPGYARVSTDLVNWSSETIDGSQFIQNQLTYTSNVDYSLTKSIDFWFNISNNQTFNRLFTIGPTIQGFPSRFQATVFVQPSASRLEVQGTNSSTGSQITLQAGFTFGQWNHFRLVQSAGVASVYINGTRTATATNWQETFSPTNVLTLLAGSARDDDFSSIDEFLVTKTVLNSPAATTITVPTQPWENDANTLLLLHFNNDLNDDSRLNVIPSAALTAVTQVSATAGVDYKANANITANSSLICLGQKSVETILSAFGDAALTVQALRIQQLEINVESQSSLSSAVNKLTNVESNQFSTTTVDVQAVVTRSAQIATESVATQLTAVVRLAGLIADDLVTTILTADAVVTRSAVSSLESSVSVFADNFKIRFNSIDIASEFNIAVATLVGKISNSDMSAVFAQTTNVLRSRDNTATLAVNSELTAIVNNLGKIEGSLFNAATLTIAAVKTVSAQSQLESITAISAISSRARPYESSLFTVFTQESIARKAVEVSLSLSAFASKLTVGAKNTAGLADLEIVSSQTCSAVKIASGQTNLVSESQLTAAITKTTRITATLSANFAVVAEGTTSIQGQANLQALAFQISAVGRVAAFFIDASMTSSLSASGNLTRSIELPLNSEFNQSTLTSRSRNALANLQTTVIQITVGGRVRNFVIPITSAMTFVSEVREIHIEEIVYVIPGEIWEYDINSETRLQVIGSESREYIIT